MAFFHSKIILGILTQEVEKIHLPIERLEPFFGGEELRSEIIPFSFTAYYEKEMGAGLFRVWVSFRSVFPRERLKELKVATMGVERDFQRGSSRIFNLDPGILTLSHLLLLTTKDYAHRIYLGDGIFCELTLLYRKGRYEALPWTYPDYRTETAQNFFQKVRNQLKRDLSFKKNQL